MWGMLQGPHSQAGQNTWTSRLFNVAEGHGLQVEADRLEHPAFDQRPRLGFGRVPKIPDAIKQAAAAGLLFSKLVEVPFHLLPPDEQGLP
jgi:hypothetical protein